MPNQNLQISLEALNFKDTSLNLDRIQKIEKEISVSII